MTTLLQRLTEPRGAHIRALACECGWGKVDSAEDLAVYKGKA